MPLPKGVVRMFATDSKGNGQFVGEDNVSHTPKNEKINLMAGEAFDIVSEFKQTSTKNLEGKSVQRSYEVSIRNRKDEMVEVAYRTRLWGEVDIKSTTKDLKNIGNSWYESTVSIPPDKEVVLTYTVVFNN